MVGGSYGGALALLLAGQDQRVDAIVPMITWNDLARAFLPESTGAGPEQGVFKKQWAGLFFGRGGSSSIADAVGAAVAGAGVANGSGDADSIILGGLDPACGRFAEDVCAAYLDVATTGQATPGHDRPAAPVQPGPALDRITAPTLLIQGQADSLFPLSEADANARGIAATGTPVRVDWFTGGHDGGEGPQSDRDRLRFLTISGSTTTSWARATNPAPASPSPGSPASTPDTRRITTTGFKTDEYPDRAGDGASRNQPWPARRSRSPTRRTATRPPSPRCPAPARSRVPSRVWRWRSPGSTPTSTPSRSRRTSTWSARPTVQIRAASPTGEAVLFVKLYDVDPDSGASLPIGLAAPVRLTGLPTAIEDATPVTVTLPGIVHRFEAGHRLRLTVATSDQAFTTPVAPAVYTVALGGPSTSVTCRPLTGEPIANPDDIWRYVLVAVIVLVALGLVTALVVARVRRRRNTVEVVRGVRGHAARRARAAQGVRRRLRRRGERGLHRPARTGGGPARARTAPARPPRCGC